MNIPIIVAAATLLLAICFALPADTFAADSNTSLSDRHAWFTYGYHDCLDKHVSVSKEQFGVNEENSHFEIEMMLCDDDHVINVEGDGVTADKITFTSMHPDVLTIDQDGTVTLRQSGIGVIKATIAADDEYKKCDIFLDVTVDRHYGWIEAAPIYYEGESPENGLDIDPSVGKERKLVVALRPGATVECTSKNPEIVSVYNGLWVYPAACGKAVIIFEVDGGGKYKSGSFAMTINVLGKVGPGYDTGAEEDEAEAARQAAEAAKKEAARKAAEKAAAEKAAAAKAAATKAAKQAELAKAKSLKKPKLKAKALKKGKIKLSWKKVKNADGYILYVKYPGQKKYVKALVKNATVKSVTHRGLTKGKVYKYKVRAYKVVNNKKYYSPFSKVRKARVK